MHTDPSHLAPIRSQATWWTPANLAFGVMVLLLMAINTTRAVLSIGTALLAVLTLWHLIRSGWSLPANRANDRRLAAVISSLFGLALLSGLNTDSVPTWLADLYAKLPLLLLPWAVALLPRFSAWQRSVLALSYLGVQTLVALVSLVVAALQYEAVIDEVKRNASVGVITGSSHIYFGLSLAFAACLGLWWFVQQQRPHPSQPAPREVLLRGERWLFLALGLVDFLALHLFTSRTGLTALYAGLALGGLVYLIQQRAWRLGLALLLVLMLTPILAFYLVPSFRIRVEVTRWDFQQYQRPEADLTYNSASLRLLAWETAAELIARHPLTGVGLSDVKDEMAQQYTRNGALERAERPLDDPHNLYLHYLVGAGVGALLWLLVVLAYPLWQTRGPTLVLMACLIGAIGVAMLFESVLQRQIGMSFLALFYLLIPQFGEPFDASPPAQAP